MDISPLLLDAGAALGLVGILVLLVAAVGASLVDLADQDLVAPARSPRGPGRSAPPLPSPAVPAHPVGGFPAGVAR